MYLYNEIEKDINAQGFLKRFVRKIFLKINKQSILNIEKNLCALKYDAEILDEKISKLNKSEDFYEDYKRRLFNLEENTRSNNQILNDVNKYFNDIDMVKIKLSRLEKKNVQSSIENRNSEIENNVCVNSNNDNNYSGIDYFDFENYFRGSREHIKDVQAQYIKYFEGKNKVIDLGCGRGEFLEILKESNINAVGVDFYEEYVDYCKEKGFNVFCNDAVTYLNSVDSTDGIFVGQVVEHLEISQIVKLCELAYDKLEEGGHLIIETPNPTSLAIFTHAFYIDPSHTKPVHPLTLKYLLEKAGFKMIEIIYTNNSKLPVVIPELSIQDENIGEFNEAMKNVQETLYGSQDYAIIGQKF